MASFPRRGRARAGDPDRGLALAILLLARRFDSAHRAQLRAIAVWFAAHFASSAIEHGGAFAEGSPRLGALASPVIGAAAAIAFVAILERAQRPIPAVWIPCVALLLLGPPTLIRGALRSGLDTATAIDAQIRAGRIDPWRMNAQVAERA